MKIFASACIKNALKSTYEYVKYLKLLDNDDINSGGNNLKLMKMQREILKNGLQAKTERLGVNPLSIALELRAQQIRFPEYFTSQFVDSELDFNNIMDFLDY